jgi:hypothetical protein
MSPEVQAKVFERVAVRRRVISQRTRRATARLLEYLPEQQGTDSLWELVEMRFQEHMARIALEGVFASGRLSTEHNHPASGWP